MRFLSSVSDQAFFFFLDSLTSLRDSPPKISHSFSFRFSLERISRLNCIEYRVSIVQVDAGKKFWAFSSSFLCLRRIGKYYSFVLLCAISASRRDSARAPDHSWGSLSLARRERFSSLWDVGEIKREERKKKEKKQRRKQEVTVVSPIFRNEAPHSRKRFKPSCICRNAWTFNRMKVCGNIRGGETSWVGGVTSREFQIIIIIILSHTCELTELAVVKPWVAGESFELCIRHDQSRRFISRKRIRKMMWCA